jgi:type II secretory pathway pseudopilin PulG
MVFYKRHTATGHFTAVGFTLVEAVVAISLIGVGVASTLGALTKFNSIAATSRNATGAAAALMTQIDLFQSMSPFNPQPSKNQIPKDTINTLPTYDMTAGAPGVPVTHTIAYKDPTINGPSTNEWPVYREPAHWTYADAAARAAASGFVNSDIGQLAYERDSQTYYRLQTTAPVWTQDDTHGLIVKGTMICTVTDISTPAMPNTYKAVFTITYQYLNHNGITFPFYSLSMTAIRSSDI